MEKELSKIFYCSPNESNPEGELAVNILVSNIIEIATLHANTLGIGNPSMEHLGAGWVLSRLTVEMKRYPKVNTEYKLFTWVETWNRHFSIRDFEIQDADGETIGYARSIWMVLNTVTHENYGLGHLSLDKSVISDRVCPIERQAKHLDIYPYDSNKEDIPASCIVANTPDAIYQFKYNDIDFYRHVNTVRYMTLLLNSYPLDFYDRMFVSRLELSFLHEGNFGETIHIRRFNEETPQGELMSSYSLYSEVKQTPILFARMRFTSR